MVQTSPTPGEIATAVGLTVPAFFSDAFDQVLQGEANYIATGEPTGAVAQIGQAVARAACRRYAAGDSATTGRQAERYERACGPYLDLLSPGRALGIANPFQGGQCQGTYTVEVRGTGVATNCGTGQVTTTPGLFNSSGGIPGPISALNLVKITPGNCGPTRSEVQGVGGNGQAFSFPGLAGSNVNSTIDYTGVSFALLRENGQPDNCGNPAPVVTPRPPTADPIGTPFRFNPIPGVDLAVDVQINPDGSITFDVGTGDVTIDPFSEVDGGGGGGGGGTSPIPPGDQGQPGDSVDVGPGGAADEEDPDRNLVGVLVQTIQTPPRANRLLNPTESYTKGAYFVYLGGVAGLTLIDTAAITRTDQFYFAPPGCNRFRVVPNAGFSIRVTPYYED